jgi:hypothetical protein
MQSAGPAPLRRPVRLHNGAIGHVVRRLGVQLVHKTIYFFCTTQGSPARAYFQSAAVALAQGLRLLGTPLFANVKYWRMSAGEDDYLFKETPSVHFTDCDVVVVEHHLVSRDGKLPEGLFAPGRKYVTVYLDRSDGIVTHSWSSEFRKFDLILKTHFNSRLSFPTNMRPWAYGLCEHMMVAATPTLDFADRRPSILWNFRVNHPLRWFARKRLSPLLEALFTMDGRTDELDQPEATDGYDYILYQQTGRRFYPRYYQRLREAAACACFGGYFVHPKTDRVWSVINSRYFLRLASELIVRAAGPQRFIHWPVLSWDSWRLWEAMAAGCVVMHVDFEKHGIGLPQMPINWLHYIGIDFENVEHTVARLKEDPEILAKISENGAAFARTHYAPVATARRFLDLITGT